MSNRNPFDVFFNQLKEAIRQDVINEILSSVKPTFSGTTTGAKPKAKRKTKKAVVVKAAAPAKSKTAKKAAKPKAKRKTKKATVKATGAAVTGSVSVVSGPVVSKKVKTKPTSPFHIPAHCIATGCTKAHKGPRFRYLCDEHRGANKEQIEAWRRERSGATTVTAPKAVSAKSHKNGKLHGVTAAVATTAATA